MVFGSFFSFSFLQIVRGKKQRKGSSVLNLNYSFFFFFPIIIIVITLKLKSIVFFFCIVPQL